MAIGTPWIGTPAILNTTGTSIAPTASGATNGEVVFVAIFSGLGSGSTITPPSGWDLLITGSESVKTSRIDLYWKVKTSADTNQSWTMSSAVRAVAVAFSYPGAYPAFPPIEGAVWNAHVSPAGVNYTTANVAPTGENRWRVQLAVWKDTTGAPTWTPDSLTVERLDVATTSGFLSAFMADSNGPVVAGGQTYNAVSSLSSTGGGCIAFAVIPGTMSGGSISATSSMSGSGTVQWPPLSGSGSITGASHINGSGTVVTPGGSGQFSGWGVEA